MSVMLPCCVPAHPDPLPILTVPHPPPTNTPIPQPITHYTKAPQNAKMVGRRLGAGLLRLGGVALSLVAYSYLELLPLRHQQAGARLSSLIVGTLGEYAPTLGAGEWGRGAGAAVPPMLTRWVGLLAVLRECGGGWREGVDLGSLEMRILEWPRSNPSIDRINITPFHSAYKPPTHPPQPTRTFFPAPPNQPTCHENTNTRRLWLNHLPFVLLLLLLPALALPGTTLLGVNASECYYTHVYMCIC